MNVSETLEMDMCSDLDFLNSKKTSSGSESMGGWRDHRMSITILCFVCFFSFTSIKFS